MIIEIKIPSPGESITEVEIGKWMVEDGDFVEKDQEIAEIESDKATLTLIAEESGKIKLKAEEGDAIAVGAVACEIDTDQQGALAKPKETKVVDDVEANTEPVKEVENAAPSSAEFDQVKVTPTAQQVMQEHGMNVDDVIAGLRRLTKKDVEAVLNAPQEETTSKTSISEPVREADAFSRGEERKRMTMLRRKLSERLVAVKNETAMLTTFNEIDMSKVMKLRKKHQQSFIDAHGFKVGFMSFFTKAVAEALKAHPMVNSMIDGDEIVTPDYADVGIAVQTPKGLMVPIIRNAESKGIAELEQEIKLLAEKARNKRISVEELTGGTFTITNGGTFGSMMSTPIINPPQSAILGMHNIVERPVAVDGKVEIRPMMYVALSYDHRIIDGKDSVGFLVKVKQLIEDPSQLVFGGKDPEKILLGL
ncbi:2-oxoglutarate dehydrogenase complex dihydrolipoyllysine-residue succinyltransferase [Puteibacter caeruleilacunae]|nr:2-oxoglutarate dehydrogenase complex dihydrolipoyllysine-residue succinyltransferase [Puteibacter caeruleilacunae]